MVQWNLAMKLGLMGLALGVVLTALSCVLLLCRQNLRTSWALAVCILFSVSFLVALGSQVTVVSKLSADDESTP